MVGRIIDVVKDDHLTIEACYTRITNTSERDEQTRFKNLFTWELARTLVAKELVIYPALEKHLSDGVTMANRNRNANHSVRRKKSTKDIQNGRANNRAKDQRGTEEIPEPESIKLQLSPRHQQFDEQL